MAEIMHKPTKIPQTATRGNLPHKKPGMETNMLPIAVATNQPPIINPLYFGGATLETKLIPIGDNNNSPKVKIK